MDCHNSGFKLEQNKRILAYPVEPRVPLGAGDFRPCCNAPDVRTAVAVVLKEGGLVAGEVVPAGREPAGELALVGREPVGTEEQKRQTTEVKGLPSRGISSKL